MNRILVIRGGAIGDFILTLPAIRLLRDRYPYAHLEILGGRSIAVLAHDRFYANAIRSLDDPTLVRFFAHNAELSGDVCDYFAAFDVIVSYLFDPDGIFSGNLTRAGAKHVITGSPKIGGLEHAARQLAQPLEQLGLHLEDPAAKLFPNQEDHRAAAEFLGDMRPDFLAVHPGSGSSTKNWAIENWSRLLAVLRPKTGFIIAGEADEEVSTQLEAMSERQHLRLAKNLPLPLLAALLQRATFLGHDSGISHLAAAAGARCVLLFGPSDPAIWAPANEKVQVIRAPDGNLDGLSVEEVAQELMRIGIRT